MPCLQFLVTTLALFHPPSRAYIDPWTGDLFGEGSVHKISEHYEVPPISGVEGGVIMSKLGNATAKLALFFLLLRGQIDMWCYYRAALGRATWKLL